MWPRIIAQLEQLTELLPYLKHAVPMVDKFLTSRSANDSAIASMVESVSSDLAHLGPANTALAGQLSTLTKQVNDIATTVEGTRSLTTSLANGVIALERQIRSLRTLLVVAIVLVAVLTLMTAWLIAHTR